jgi:hypothetical protein
MLTLEQQDFLHEFSEIGFVIAKQDNPLITFAPTLRIQFESDKNTLKEIFALRIRNPERLSKNELERQIKNHYHGGVAELADIFLYRASVEDYIKQFNESLPQPSEGKRGGDPGFDYILKGKRIDSKITQNTRCDFSFPLWYKDLTIQKCDYFTFHRWDNAIKTLGYADWKSVTSNFELKTNHETGQDFLGLDLSRLYDLGLLHTNVYTLMCI